MTRSGRVIVSLCLPGLLAAAGFAHATNYTLWINGRNGKGEVGNYNSFNYWGPADRPAGVNKKSVNWDGYNTIGSENGKIRAALDCFCTGENWCYIGTHSAGDLMIGYALANFGGSARSVGNAQPNAAGVCGTVGAATQIGWNIKWIRSAASSAGGSELADAGRWTTGEPLVHEHKVSTARAMYNHNETRNIWFYMYSGARGTLYAALLPGQDDEVVAYHSSGAVSGTAGGAYCNPSDWWCNDLTLWDAVNEGGWPKWNYHSVVLRDDKETYKHYTNERWEGPTSAVRWDMELWAR